MTSGTSFFFPPPSLTVTSAVTSHPPSTLLPCALSHPCSLLMATSCNQGNGEWAPDFNLTVLSSSTPPFFFFVKTPRLCWPTLLFLSNHLSSRGHCRLQRLPWGPLDQPGESLRGSTHCDCWPRRAVVKVVDASWKRVATTSRLINTVQSGISQLGECSISLPPPPLPGF